MRSAIARVRTSAGMSPGLRLPRSECTSTPSHTSSATLGRYSCERCMGLRVWKAATRDHPRRSNSARVSAGVMKSVPYFAAKPPSESTRTRPPRFTSPCSITICTPGCFASVVRNTDWHSRRLSIRYLSVTVIAARISSPSGSTSAISVPSRIESAVAASVESVIGIGQKMPRAVRISAHTPRRSARSMKPSSGAKPPMPSMMTSPFSRQLTFNLGAGVDALLARGVVPAELPIVRLVDAGMAVKIAEYVCFAIARITRGLDRFAQPPHGLRDWNAARPRDEAPRVGVLGLGAMGTSILEAAARFGYPVAGWSRGPRRIAGVETFAGMAQLDAFLARTQILVDALPLTAQTQNLLDRRALAQMPHGAHVINVGRGGTIVDEDLLAALDEGRLASATLDVVRVEPLPAEHPFWSHPKGTVTPHLAAPTPYDPAADEIAAALQQLEQGVPARDLPGYVGRPAGY